MANLYRLFTLCPLLFIIHICSSDVRPTFTGCSHFVIRENSPSWLLSNFVFVQPIVSNLILYLSASEHCSGLQAFQRDRVAGLQSSWANRFLWPSAGTPEMYTDFFGPPSCVLEVFAGTVAVSYTHLTLRRRG